MIGTWTPPGAIFTVQFDDEALTFGRSKGVVRCRRCASRADGKEMECEVWEDGQGVRWKGGEDVTMVAVPGVLRLLDVELASMGVRMRRLREAVAQGSGRHRQIWDEAQSPRLRSDHVD